MDTINQALSAVRMMESNGNYNAQQSVRVDGQVDRKVGAYGILESRWQTLTQSLGYGGARWQDNRMQDIVAREKLERDYEVLGNWELAVMSFRYGMPFAQAMSDRGYTEPKDVELAGYKDVAKYMRNVRRYQKEEHPVEGKLNQPTPSSDTVSDANPTRKRYENVIRSMLISMRDTEKGRSGANGSDEAVEQVGDTGIPATAE
jgi:hypothetical protein